MAMIEDAERILREAKEEAKKTFLPEIHKEFGASWSGAAVMLPDKNIGALDYQFQMYVRFPEPIIKGEQKSQNAMTWLNISPHEILDATPESLRALVMDRLEKAKAELRGMIALAMQKS